MAQITAPESRADPYPLFAMLRETPVSEQSDGVFVVSTHAEVSSLLHDPRVSSDPRHTPDMPVPPRLPFIIQDGLDHDRLRRLAMREFGPPSRPGLVTDQERAVVAVVDELISAQQGQDELDVVDGVSYPLPVSVICRLMGVPREDEGRFRQWADDLVKSVGAVDQADTDELLELQGRTRVEMFLYFGELIERYREHPDDTILSRLLHGPPDDRMTEDEIATTAVLLFLAGHETTVNLISNGMLTLLRNPEVLAELRADEDLAIPLVEELLRFEPPIQYLPNRNALADLDIGGTTIPKGSRILLLLASASRDPDRFEQPDRFQPHRPDNQHFGFGGGIHYCFGAPLARLEAQVALTALARRLEAPELVDDPPPYRPSPVLRGPEHLRVAVRGIGD
jgi:cytochrome P450